MKINQSGHIIACSKEWEIVHFLFLILDTFYYLPSPHVVNTYIVGLTSYCDIRDFFEYVTVLRIQNGTWDGQMVLHWQFSVSCD